MRLQSTILIHRPADQVWRYLGDVDNIPRWDRGVAGVKRSESESMGVGSTFSTFAAVPAGEGSPAPGEMIYRIAEVDSDRRVCTVELVSRGGNARFFRNATWEFRTEPVQEGTRVTCCAEFVLRARYLLLAPVLYLMRGAILDDLKRLKAAIEHTPCPGPQ